METTNLNRLAFKVFGLFVLSTILLSPALAQQIPPQASPALILKNTEQQMSEPGRESKEVFPPPAPVPQPGETVELELPPKSPLIQLPDASYPVETITVEGNTLLSAESLDHLLQNCKGKVLTSTEIGLCIEKINDEYRKQGYITTIAYVPTQDLSQGHLLIRVQEGKIGQISVDGNRTTRHWVVLWDFGYRTGDFFNLQNIEATLSRINQQGHYQVRAILSPGTQPGETDIRLVVSDKQPWQLSPSFDNQGITPLGMYRWGTQVSRSNLLGIKDPFSALWLQTSNSQQVISTYSVPVRRNGDRINALFAFSEADFKQQVPQPNITGTAYSYAIYYAHPLDRRGLLTADISFNAIRTSSFVQSNQTSREDYRVFRAGLNLQETDRFGRTFARVESSWGVNILGGDQKFWKASGGLSRVIRLPLNNWLLLRGAWQLTPDALGIAELITIGGNYTVRGYSEQLLFGDRGYRLSAEHRWPIPFLRKVSPWLSERVQGDSFVDFGQVWFDRSSPFFLPGESNRSGRTVLLGVGFGARVQLTRLLSGFIDCGFGLVDRRAVEFEAQPTARVHFGIRTDLLNTGYYSPAKKP